MVHLQEQPCRILRLLLEHSGEVVTRETLREALGPNGTFVEFERSLNAAIAKVRQALGDSAENPRYVETVARQGYRLIAPVQNSAVPPEAAAASPETASAASSSSWDKRLFVAFVLVIGGLGWRIAMRPTTGEGVFHPVPAALQVAHIGASSVYGKWQVDPAPSPDDHRIAFSWRREIYRVPLDGAPSSLPIGDVEANAPHEVPKRELLLYVRPDKPGIFGRPLKDSLADKPEREFVNDYDMPSGGIVPFEGGF